MPETSFVQVFECTEGKRRATHCVPLGLFMNYALERLSPPEIMQLRDDLAILGRSRIGGTEGRWREYEMIGDPVEESGATVPALAILPRR